MRPRAFISKKWMGTVLKTGLIAGSLDILLAFIDAWWSADVPPGDVLRFVASGLLGDIAFKGSQWIVLIGLIIHYLIAFFWTLIFFCWYPKIRSIITSQTLQAIVYGLFIWLVMNLLVLPLTAAPNLGFQWWSAVKGAIILIIAIGIPLAIKAKQFYKNRNIVYRRRKPAHDTKT